jgi:molybdopterin converting factor small subunit
MTAKVRERLGASETADDALGKTRRCETENRCSEPKEKMNKPEEKLALKVNVGYFGYIQRLLGVEKEETVGLKEGSLVSDLLLLLGEKHGDAFKNYAFKNGDSDLKSNLIMTLNGATIGQLNGIKTELKKGDRVLLMTLISGG